MPDNEPFILLFDGVCNLCNGMVQFMIKRDPQKKFRFASLQSDTGQKLLRKFGLRTDHLYSLVLIRGDKYYLRSSAGLRVMKELGGGWKLLYALMIFPKPVRDLVYNLIAQLRYKVFGKRETCMVPTPELKERFLDQTNEP